MSSSKVPMALSKCNCPFPLHLCLLLYVFTALLQAPFSFADDRISANQSVSGSQRIISKNGNFVLGFFTPLAISPSSNNNYYVGIWYNRISLFTTVWVANREIPVSDPNTSLLKISDDGNLVLLDQSKAIIWSTNASVLSNSTVGVILTDAGNLQLRDESNSSMVFWQSFDHPTDSWLPGGKLGLNKVTKQRQQIIAWKSKDDPAPGVFSLEIDPDGSNQYFIIWNMSKKYWTSGLWEGERFSLLPEMNQDFLYNYHYVSNEEENYFTYTMKDPNITSRLVVDYDSGQIRQVTWRENLQAWMLHWSVPRGKCLVYALCGPFASCNDVAPPFCNCMKGFSVRWETKWNSGDKSAGCMRNTPLQCDRSSSANSESDGFFEMPNVRLPDNSIKLATVGSSGDCELACLSNCSCTAYSYNSTGCFVWYGHLLNLQEQYELDDGTLYLRLAASELQSNESSRKGVPVWVIAGILVAATVACVAIVWVIVWRRRPSGSTRTSNATGGSFLLFSHSELQRATRNFSEKLGQGGFGSVFKGSLPDTTAIAVKKLEGVGQGEKQFRSEVSTIGTVQHVNLVRLLGFCSRGSEKLLVYEFMANGSLASQLFGNNSNTLNWETRYQIAVGIARGLAYLHEQCRECIIHCDIKPENILLDASFVPKIADFGLAKLVGREFSRVLTTMRGTRGYLAPEWFSGMPIAAKADVYSFGMVLFEIISGKRNLRLTGEVSSFEFFPVMAMSKLVIPGDVESLLDDRLEGDAKMEELERACKVAYWCIQDDESRRPAMGLVVQALLGVVDVAMPPLPRSLQMLTEDTNPTYWSSFTSDQSSQMRSM